MTPPEPTPPPSDHRTALARRVDRPLGAVIAVCAWVGLIVMYVLAVGSGLERQRSLLGITIRYFGFFTNLSNLLIAVGLTCRLLAPGSRTGRFFARPSVTAASALYIVIVALVYSLVLRRLWDPTGWLRLADTLLHDVVPAAYVLYWALVLPKQRLPWRAALTWLLFPFAYFIYTLAKGSFVGYPYPFLNVATLGYGAVLLNGVYLLAAFLVLGTLTVAIARWLSRAEGRRT